MTQKFKITLGTFDLLKGFLMLTIIFGHTLEQYQSVYPSAFMWLGGVVYFLCGGGNNLFCAVTGYCLKEKPAKVMLKKTFQELIIPYLLVFAAVIIFFPVIHFLTFHELSVTLRETGKYVLTFLFGMHGSFALKVFGIEVFDCSVVHFLLALFIALNLFNLLIKIKNTAVQAMLSVVCFALGLTAIPYYSIWEALMFVSYCYVGYLVKQTGLMEKLCSRKWLLILLTLVSAGVFLCLNKFSDAALAVIFWMFFQTVVLLTWGVALSAAEGKIPAGIRQVGMYTYWLMCLHAVEFMCVPWYHWFDRMNRYPVAGWIAALLCKAIILSAGCLLLKKWTKYRYMKKIRKTEKMNDAA